MQSSTLRVMSKKVPKRKCILCRDLAYLPIVFSNSSKNLDKSFTLSVYSAKSVGMSPVSVWSPNRIRFVTLAAFIVETAAVYARGEKKTGTIY